MMVYLIFFKLPLLVMEMIAGDIDHRLKNISVIHSVSELLRSFIGANVYELSGNERIVFDSPAQIESNGETMLSLYLYQTEINPYLRNLTPVITLNNADPGQPVSMQLAPPPLVLDLKYMMVPYARTSDLELLLVDRVVSLFGSAIELKPSIDEVVLQKTGNLSFNVIPEDPSSHDLRDLWAGFHDKSYRITKLFRVTPVCIPATLSIEAEMTIDAQLSLSPPVAK